MGKLDGKVAVVTGGNSGIGLAAAQRFVEDGAYVFITGRRQEELDAAVRQIGRNVQAIRGDVSQLADLERIMATVQEQKGRIDVLFANVKGALFAVQKALPVLRDGASIIFTSSVVGSKGLPGVSVYSATKAALRSLARTLTTELKGRKIRVNVVSPGTIDTPGLQALRNLDAQGLHEHYAAAIPLGRLGRTDEIANAVAFLASDESSYVTGTELFVDGGMAQV